MIFSITTNNLYKLTVSYLQCVGRSSGQLSIPNRVLGEIDATIKLSEAGQSSSSHPNDKVFVLKSIVGVVICIQFP